MAIDATYYRFQIGQPVIKLGGDYTFIGIVRARWVNGLGKIRYVVEAENPSNQPYFQYMAHIFSEE